MMERYVGARWNKPTTSADVYSSFVPKGMKDRSFPQLGCVKFVPNQSSHLDLARCSTTLKLRLGVLESKSYQSGKSDTRQNRRQLICFAVKAVEASQQHRQRENILLL